MDIKKNITSLFIVPTLKITKDDIKGHNMINGYLIDIERDTQYEDSVYILFRPPDMLLFQGFVEKQYETNKLLIDDYDYDDGFVVLVYKLPSKFKKDYDLIKEGKYSETSKEYQNIFPKIIKIVKNGLHRDEISLQYRVFRKSPELKKYWEDLIDINFTDSMEVWPGFDLFTETLDLDKVKKELYEDA